MSDDNYERQPQLTDPTAQWVLHYVANGCTCEAAGTSPLTTDGLRCVWAARCARALQLERNHNTKATK